MELGGSLQVVGDEESGEERDRKIYGVFLVKKFEFNYSNTFYYYLTINI